MLKLEKDESPFRWVRRKPEFSEIVNGQNVGPKDELVLQWRTRKLDEEYRFVWTEWQDVPAVNDAG